jgi:hypothetical protein
VFACGVDLNISLRGTILEETHGAYDYFRTKKWFARI